MNKNDVKVENKCRPTSLRTLQWYLAQFLLLLLMHTCMSGAIQPVFLIPDSLYGFLTRSKSGFVSLSSISSCLGMFSFQFRI